MQYFTWIDKEEQKSMLACVSRSLKKGGQFVFEFGGYGNNAMIHCALEKTFTEHGYIIRCHFIYQVLVNILRLLSKQGFK